LPFVVAPTTIAGDAALQGLSMPYDLGVVMDPIATIKPHKDSTFAMMLAAQARGWPLWYMEACDLFLVDGRCHARMRPVTVRDSSVDWYAWGAARVAPLDTLPVVLMRKDPPVDMEYVHATQLLELAERRGTLVVNRPAALRDLNEKLATAWLPDCCVPTRVTCDTVALGGFLDEQDDIVVKPLDAMGGQSVFRVRRNDPNRNVIFETLTANGMRYAMAQRFIPEIRDGDKRILLVDGEPVPYALARVPKAGETRGNLAAGGTGHGVPLGERERWIAGRVGNLLRERGVLFAGIDVIGDWLTEVNITSPTCIRELDRQYGLDIAGQLLERIAARLGGRG
jgi:glutathione synthase